MVGRKDKERIIEWYKGDKDEDVRKREKKERERGGKREEMKVKRRKIKLGNIR